MSTLASDSFTRADAETLGANWVLYIAVSESLGIFSNQVDVTVASSAEGNAYDGSISWPNDQWSQATFVVLPSYESFVCVRGEAVSGTTRNMYMGGYDIGDRGDGFTDISKFVGTVLTDLGNSGVADISAGKVVYLEAQGTTLVCKVGGVTKVTVTDASLTAGKPGLACLHSTIDVALFDDWSGGDFAAATAASGVGYFLRKKRWSLAA